MKKALVILLAVFALMGVILYMLNHQGTAQKNAGAREQMPVAPERAGAELLQNGGAEQAEGAVAAGWENPAGGASSSTEYASGGARSIKLASGKAEYNPHVQQRVAINPDGKPHGYRLQYETRGAEMMLDYRGSVSVWDGEKQVQAVDLEWRQGKNDWQKVATDFVVTNKATAMLVTLQIKGPATMWFDNISLKPVTKAEQLPAALGRFRGSDQYVQIMPDRTFRAAGRPFFPIMVWGWSPRDEQDMATVHDYGFNLLCSQPAEWIGAGMSHHWLDTLQEFHLKGVVLTRFEMADKDVPNQLPIMLNAAAGVIREVKDHPALFAYMISDEPAWGGYNLEAFAEGAALIRAMDPRHPIYVNHAPRNTIDQLALYNRYADISGCDIYPVWKEGLPDRHSDLPNKTLGVVGDETAKNLAAVAGAKPVMQTLQAFAWSDGNAPEALKKEEHPFPTRVQMRFMAYDAIVSGASGLTFFQDHRYKELRPELKPVIRELAALQDALAGGKSIVAERVCFASEIRLLAKEYRGRRVVIAVNRTNVAVTARFDAGKLFAKPPPTITVLFENRQLPAGVAAAGKGADGAKAATDNRVSFTDEFKPYDVHVYSDSPDGKEVLTPFIPLADPLSSDPNTGAAKIGAEENILTNPGMEFMFKYGWGFNLNGAEGGFIEENPHGGKSCVFLRNNSGQAKYIYASQGFAPIKAGSKVHGSVWVRTPDPAVQYQVYCDIVADVDGKGLEWFAGPGTGVLSNNVTEWRKVEFEFDFPNDQADQQGRFRHMLGWTFYLLLRTPGTIYFDDAQITVQLPTKAKKLIEWGWDQPTPEYIRQNIRAMEKLPFDGVIFWLRQGCNDPKSYGGTIFAKEKWDETKFAQIFEDCRNIEWRKFTDNFVCIYSASASTMDWFSDADWEAVRHNLGIVTRAAVLARCRGICFDAEPYGNNPWSYPTQVHADKKTFAEYEAKARQRGAEFIRAISLQMPKCVIHTMFQLSYFQGIMDEPDPVKRAQMRSQHPYSLLPAFLNGMLDAAGPDMVITDGNEDAYYYASSLDFYKSYHMMRQRALAMIAPENVRKYQAQMQVSQALYMDYVFGTFPSSPFKDMTPEERAKWFEHNVYYALATSDEFVWLYSERMNWWKNTGLPSGIIESVESARKKLNERKGLGTAALDDAWKRLRAKLNRRTAEIVRLPQPPAIDGKLNDEAWKAVLPLGDFVALFTRDAKIEAATRVWVAYDDRNLYVAFQCAEPKMDKMKIVAQKQESNRHDGNIWSDDNLEIFLSLGNGAVPFVHFAMNPGNVQWDSFHPEHAVGCYPYAQTDFDPNWQSAVVIGDKEWTAEVAIPWAEMGMSAPRPGSKLCANLCRNRQPVSELSTWSQNIKSFIEDENFGIWEFK